MTKTNPEYSLPIIKKSPTGPEEPKGYAPDVETTLSEIAFTRQEAANQQPDVTAQKLLAETALSTHIEVVDDSTDATTIDVSQNRD